MNYFTENLEELAPGFLETILYVSFSYIKYSHSLSCQSWILIGPGTHTWRLMDPIGFQNVLQDLIISSDSKPLSDPWPKRCLAVLDHSEVSSVLAPTWWHSLLNNSHVPQNLLPFCKALKAEVFHQTFDWGHQWLTIWHSHSSPPYDNGTAWTQAPTFC